MKKNELIKALKLESSSGDNTTKPCNGSEKKKGIKFVDVVGRTTVDTFLLFELKFNRRQRTLDEAWADAEESISSFLLQNQKRANPYEFVLAAGITFNNYMANTTVSWYLAKLIDRDGSLVEIYTSANIPSRVLSKFNRTSTYTYWSTAVQTNKTVDVLR